eukprot:8180592-Pyramimonas_sp.AAC.1
MVAVALAQPGAAHERLFRSTAPGADGAVVVPRLLQPLPRAALARTAFSALSRIEAGARPTSWWPQ